MIRLGLTGSIGMGKTTTAAMFAEEGVPVFDADATVHDLYQTDAVEPVAELFPEAISNGVVDRSTLAKLVTGKPQALKSLEAVVHPLVRQKERDFLNSAKASGSRVCILDIPLLFETSGEDRVDQTVVVTADAETQRKRVLARPGMTEEKFDALLARQMPDHEKRARADFIVDTSRGFQDALQQVCDILAALNDRD